MTVKFDQPSGDVRADLLAGRNVLFRRFSPAGVRVTRVADGDGGRTLRFVCATEGPKRDGHQVRIGNMDAGDEYGFIFKNFKKNPVMLWSHWQGGFGGPPLPPIGAWSNWTIEKIDGRKALVMDGRFAKHALAEEIFQCFLPVSEGGDECLFSVSIGWMCHKHRDITDADGHYIGSDMLVNELYETSPVGIPADPDANMVKQMLQNPKLGREMRSALTDWLAHARAGAYVLDFRERDEAPAAGLPAEPPTDPTADPTAEEVKDRGLPVETEKPEDEPKEEANTDLSKIPTELLEPVTTLMQSSISLPDAAQALIPLLQEEAGGSDETPPAEGGDGDDSEEGKKLIADALDACDALVAAIGGAVEQLREAVLGEQADDTDGSDDTEDDNPPAEGEAAAAPGALERKGAVLSRENLEALRSASGLIKKGLRLQAKVIGAAKAQDEPREAPEPETRAPSAENRRAYAEALLDLRSIAGGAMAPAQPSSPEPTPAPSEEISSVLETLRSFSIKPQT